MKAQAWKNTYWIAETRPRPLWGPKAGFPFIISPPSYTAFNSLNSNTFFSVMREFAARMKLVQFFLLLSSRKSIRKHKCDLTLVKHPAGSSAVYTLYTIIVVVSTRIFSLVQTFWFWDNSKPKSQGSKGPLCNLWVLAYLSLGSNTSYLIFKSVQFSLIIGK